MKSKTWQGGALIFIAIFIFSLASFAILSESKPSVEIIGSIKSEYNGAQHQIQIKDEKSFHDALISDPVAFFTLILALFTMVLAAVTIALWLEAKRASAEQASFTKESLMQTQVAVSLARQALIADHRPWFDVRCEWSRGFISEGFYHCVFSVFGVNVGKSPSNYELVSFQQPDATGLQEDLFQRAHEVRRERVVPGGHVFPGQTTLVLGETIRSEIEGFGSSRPVRIVVAVFYALPGEVEVRSSMRSFVYVIRRTGESFEVSSVGDTFSFAE